MNRLQKKILTIAALLGNISLTTVVASVATVAWYSSQANVTLESVNTRIEAPESDDVEWEILKYDDDVKSGVSYHDAREFFLQAYDEYLPQKNPKTNVILKVNVGVDSFNATNQMYVDVNCVAGHEPGAAAGADFPKFTSNICQFKSFVASYVDENDETFEVNPMIDDSTAATDYQTASNYFASLNTPGNKFVAFHNQTPNKRSNQLTLIPYFDPGADIVKNITIYIECSYNPDLVSYFIEKNAESGENDLVGDISLFSFRVGQQYSGAYVKVTSQAELDTSGEYLITYDGFSDDYDVAFDGSGTSNSKYTSGQNYIDVHSSRARIKNNETVAKSTFSYNTSNAKLTSKAGYVVGGSGGAAASGMNASQSGAYTNALTYNADGSVSSVSNGRTLQYNTTRGSTNFNYYTAANQQPINFYKYDENAIGDLVLTGIQLGGGYPTEIIVGNEFDFEPGTVTAIYNEGAYTQDVTNAVTFSGYNMNVVGQYTVMVTYNDPEGGSASAVYTLHVVNPPKTLVSIEATGMKTNYVIGETFSFDGTLMATYSDDSTSSVTPTNVITSSLPLDASNRFTATGTFEVRLEYEEDGVTAECNYNVTVAAPILDWQLIQNIDDLESAEDVIIVSNEYDMIAGTYSSGDYIPNLSLPANSLSIDKLTISEIPSGASTFSVSKTGSQYYFKNSSNQYLTSTSANKTTIVAPDPLGADQQWTVSFSGTDETNYVTMYLATRTSDKLQYNASAPRFRVYSSSQTKIQLYGKLHSSPLDHLVLTPTKTSYFTGDTFENPTIEAHFEDGSHKAVAPADCVITGYDMNAVGSQTVTVSYTKNGVTETATYTIDVVKTVPTSISILNPSTHFYTGDTFTVGASPTIRIYYNNGTNKLVNSGVTYSGYNMSTPGTQTVTASYTESGETVTTTYQITVTQKDVQSIVISSPATKTVFIQGETFTSTGLGVTANFNNGVPENVTEQCEIIPPNMNVVGVDKTVTIRYTYAATGNTVSTSYNIRINAPLDVSSISLDTSAAKTTYSVGETFTSANVIVTAHMNDGTTSNVTGSATVNPANGTVFNAAGTRTITVSYTYPGGSTVTATYNVVVSASGPITGTAKYSITGKTAATQTGSIPSGATHSYASTYGTNYQLTGGNSMELTLNGYTGVTITRLTLSMKSNSSKGSGNLSYSTNSGANYTYIINTAEFKNSSWNGAWSSSYIDIVKDVSITGVSGQSIKIKIAATINSLYCQRFTIDWEKPSASSMGGQFFGTPVVDQSTMYVFNDPLPNQSSFNTGTRTNTSINMFNDTDKAKGFVVSLKKALMRFIKPR